MKTKRYLPSTPTEVANYRQQQQENNNNKLTMAKTAPCDNFQIVPGLKNTAWLH